MIGQMLAHYEVVSQLGKGGMGEVFRARDTKLDRDVALKLLPPELSRDHERLARFRREAKVLASLNHPSIAALYGLEESEGRVFIVMELAEGEDLSRRLEKGAIPLQDAMGMALSITEGLEAAHAKGIVHRDLKPANVMLSDNGRIKLLDFGLARAFDTDEASGDPMMSPTITSAGMTAAGVILGTAAYMSPEQARGKQIGKQSDIWAFGALFFEMLTGHRLFDGETVSDSIGAILHKEPDWNLLPPDSPPQIIQLLHRCLERDTDRRLRDIGDARVAIIDAQRDPTGSSMGLSGPMRAAPPKTRAWLAPVVGIVALVLGVAGGMQISTEQADTPYRVLDLGIDVSPSNAQDDGIQAAIAPDGHAVAFTHEGKIWLQKFDELEARPLDGSEDGFAPFWSPDGQTLGWFGDGRIWRVAASGGRPSAVCEIAGQTAGGVGASWARDGRIYYGTGFGAVMSVDALGGQPREEIPVADGVNDLHEPYVLPNGGGILYVSHPSDRSPVLLELWRDGEHRLIFDGGQANRVAGPVYDPSGYILFRMLGGPTVEGLWAIAFDSDTGSASGEAFLVQSDGSEASIADDGTIVYLSNPRRSNNLVISSMTPGSTQREVIVPAHSGGMEFRLSPDGTKIAFTAEPEDGGRDELWVRDLTRGIETCLTSMEHIAAVPRWSPDSREILFTEFNLELSQAFSYRIPADGSRPPESIGPGIALEPLPDGSGVLTAFSAGRDHLAFTSFDSLEVRLVSFDESTEARRVVGGDARYFATGFTPDADYLFFNSNAAGREAIYMTKWPEIEGRWKLSQGEVVGPGRMAPDGSVYYYISEGSLYSVSLNFDDAPLLGRPERVLELPQGGDYFDVALDGNILIRHANAAADVNARESRRGVKVVDHWIRKLEGR